MYQAEIGKLTLRLLGAPEIYLDDHLLRFPTRKAQALLIYLAVEGGLHSRAALTTFFWPDNNPESASAAFRNTLARLRRVLQNRVQLLIEGDLLGLVWGDSPDMDVHHLERSANHAHLKAIRGGFLEGFTLDDSLDFDDWAMLKREYYFQRLNQIYDDLTLTAVVAGKPADFATRLELLLAWLKHDPTSERAHRRLIELHVGAGDRPSALKAYQTCCTVLEAELGVQPSPETYALVKGIQTESLPRRANNYDHLTTLETALNLVADHALFINPTGRYSDKSIIRRHLAQGMIQGFHFNIYDFRVSGCCVQYSYQVLEKNIVLDTGDDGFTIVHNGKIIFDGTVRSVPPDLQATYAAIMGSDSVEIVQAFYRALNSQFEDILEKQLARSLTPE